MFSHKRCQRTCLEALATKVNHSYIVRKQKVPQPLWMKNIPLDKVTDAERRLGEQGERKQTPGWPDWPNEAWSSSEKHVEIKYTTSLLSSHHSIIFLGEGQSIKIFPFQCFSEPWVYWFKQARNGRGEKNKNPQGTHSSWPRQTYPHSHGHRHTPTLS